MSDTHAAEQLLVEVRKYTPNRVPVLEQVSRDHLRRWRADDGASVASFLLYLFGALGSFGDSDARQDTILTFVSRLGPPLGGRPLVSLTNDLAEAVVGRADATALRRIASALVRRAAAFDERPWRAQLRFLEGLLEINGMDALFKDVNASAPDLHSIVVRNEIAKRLAGDIFVDCLGLANIASLHEQTGTGLREKNVLDSIRFCVFPARARFEGDEIIDVLTEERMLAPRREAYSVTHRVRSAFFAANG